MPARLAAAVTAGLRIAPWVAVGVSITIASFVACTDADAKRAEGGGDDSVIVTSDGAIDPPSAIERGEGIVDSLGCAGCHQSADPSTMLAGADMPVSGSEAFGGNLTPDPVSGIGRWTDVQMTRAIRDGVGAAGRTLCATMPRYPNLDDEDVSAMIAYLRSLPPIIHTVAASVCGGDETAAATAALAMDLGDAGDAALDAVDPTVRGTPLPAPGELVINEVMANPTGPEPNDEWIEMYNRADAAVSLRGITVVDSESRFVDVTGAPDLGPGEYALFARTREGATMTALPTPAFVYGEALGPNQGVVLTNDDRGAVAVRVGDVLIDRFEFGTVPHKSTGATVERASPNDAGALGCIGRTAWAPDAGKGTPGAANDCVTTTGDAATDAR